MVLLFQSVDFFNNDVFKSVFKLDKVKNGHAIFSIHYKLSVWLAWLYMACYSYLLMSGPISCMGSKYGDTKAGLVGFRAEVEEYCLAHGTYTVRNLDPAKEIFPGIGTVTGGINSIRFQLYYKWTFLYIIAMLIVLRIPWHVWRLIENGRMTFLVKNLKCIFCRKNAEEIEKEKELLADYLYCHAGYHRIYAYGYIFAEFLNIMVSLFLMLMWDSIADNEFSLHGAPTFGVMRTPHMFRTDGLAKVFPILAKCTLNTYGAGGDVQPNDFVCTLPLNLINGPAAVFFWYYFMMMLAVGICAMIYRISIIGSRWLRMYLLSGLTPLTPLEDIETVINSCSYSDWFVVYQLGLFMEPFTFKQIVQKLVQKLHASKLKEGNSAALPAVLLNIHFIV